MAQTLTRASDAQIKTGNQQNALWYTRCPVPTALGIAAQQGWLSSEFAEDGIDIRSIQETADPNARESHFDHTLPWSFRQGGNIPAIWARAKGRDTRVIGLSWTDEFQAAITLPTSGITQGQELKGRRIGLPVHPVSIDFNRATALRGFAKALELSGLNLRDVEHVDIQVVREKRTQPEIGWHDAGQQRRRAYGAELDALLAGTVDAIYVKGALGAEAAKRINAVVISEIGFHPDPVVRINNGTPRTLTVDAGLIDARPDLVARFARRVVEAGQWAATHPTETLRYIAEESGSTEQWAKLAYGDNVHERLTTFLSADAINALSDFKSFLFEHGFIDTNFSVDEWIHTIDEIPRV